MVRQDNVCLLHMPAMKPDQPRLRCLARMRHAPWAEICFGDDPIPLLLLLLLSGFVLSPLLRDLWFGLLLLLLLAIPLRAWAWCREQAQDDTVQARQDDRGASA